MPVLSDTENSSSEFDVDDALQVLKSEGKDVKDIFEDVEVHGPVTTWPKGHKRTPLSFGIANTGRMIARIPPYDANALNVAYDESTLHSLLETSLAETQHFRHKSRHLESRVANLELTIHEIMTQMRLRQSSLDSDLAADDDVIFGLPDKWLQNARRVKIKRARAGDVISFYVDEDEGD